MSSKKTSHYKLHQWEPSDHFLRTEFNDNFTTIDTALEAERAAVNILNTALREKAEIVTGTYTGDGAESQVVTLGFRPRMVLIWSVNGETSDTYHSYGGLSVEGQDAVNDAGTPIITLTAMGFEAHYYGKAGSGFLAPRVNTSGQRYNYFALR